MEKSRKRRKGRANFNVMITGNVKETTEVKDMKSERNNKVSEE